MRVEASGICGSDLHIYHGRIRVAPGFTIGHEFVGTVLEAGDAVTTVAVGDRVLGCYQTACGTCWFCRRGLYHKCDHSRTFGHGALLGSLQGAQADQVLVPGANLCLRRVPDGMDPGVALFAGDVMGTGYHAVVQSGMRPGDLVGVVGLGPVGLCAVLAARAAGAAKVFAVDTVPDRLDMARSLRRRGAPPRRRRPAGCGQARDRRPGPRRRRRRRGHPDALDLAIRLARKAGTVSATGVYAEKLELHMGLVWIKALTLRTGHANVIGHVDHVLDLLASGILDPTPLVTRHMSLEDAPEAYALYDHREALKIVLEP